MDLTVPDRRFGLVAPRGMCERHLEMRRGYRDMYFDDRRGYRWPGAPVLEWSVIPEPGMMERRRIEWDEKAAEQMRLIEVCCLSGRSPQCEGYRTCLSCGLRPPDAEWLAWIESPPLPGCHRAQTRASRCLCA